MDDEPLARERIRTLLENENDFEIAGECKNGKDALNFILKFNPDLVFLDIQMPGMNGFKVIENLGSRSIPEFVFVTAYDKFAIKAFEVNAIDYLLKPFDKERFLQTLKRVQDRTDKNAKSSGELIKILQKIKNESDNKKYTDRFAIKSSGRITFIDTEEVDLFEAAGNYVRIYTNNEKHLLRETLTSLEEKLDPSKFIRVHRSYIVKIRGIKEMKAWFKGQYVLILHNNIKIKTGRTYNDSVKKLF